MKSCVILYTVVIVTLLAVCFILTAFLCVVLTKKEILQKHLSESTAPGKIDHTWLDVRGFIVYEHPV